MKKFLPLLIVPFLLAGCTQPQSKACQDIKAIDSSAFFDRLNPNNPPATIEKDMQSVIKSAASLEKTAPVDQTENAKKLKSSLVKIQEVLVSVQYRASEIANNSAAKSALEKAQQESKQATDALDSYYKTTCKK